MSLNGSLIPADAQGKLLVGALNVAVPAWFNGGTPLTSDLKLAITDATTGLIYVAGLAYDAVGRLAETQTGPAVSWTAGVPVTASGRVLAESGAIATYSSTGIPLTASGAVAMAVTAGTTPADMFAAGELGAWWDPSDLSSLFQDSAGTTPVTAAGQPVGKVTDKSGRGLHLTQATAASRPLLQQEGGRNYLDFDGVDDGYTTISLNLSGVNGQVVVWAGLYKDVNAGAGQVIEFSPSSGSNLNCFAMQAPPGDLNGYFWRSRGAGAADGTIDLAGYTPPIKNVVVGIGNVPGDISTIRVDSVPTTTNVDQGTGGYATYQLYIGRRGGTTFPFKGRMYGLIVRAATTTAQHVVDIEQWMAAKVGISF